MSSPSSTSVPLLVPHISLLKEIRDFPLPLPTREGHYSSKFGKNVRYLIFCAWITYHGLKTNGTN